MKKFSVILIVFCLVFSNFNINKVKAEDDISYGLVGHWTLDEENPVNGTTVIDSSGNNHNGTWRSSGEGNYSGDGRIGNFGGVFEKGGDNQYIEILNDSDFSFSSGFSTSFWVKPTSWNIWNVILSKDSWDSGGWLVLIFDVINSKGTICYGKANFDDMCSVRADEALSLDTWTHVAIINNNGSAKIYLNGSEVASGIVSLEEGYNTNFPMNIGVRDNEIGNDNFNGLIDDVRIYNRALTLGEIAILSDVELISLEGEGTEEDPYQIDSCSKLQKVNEDLDAYYILTDNIDCSMTNPEDEAFDNSGIWSDETGFDPIVGDDENSFTGHFDGNDKNISNLFISKDESDYIGLFGYFSSPAIIKDLNLIDFDIDGDEYVGALVGKADEDVLLDNVSVTGVIDGHYGVGGIAGLLKGTISNSESDVEVEAGNRYAGGIAGILSGVEGNRGSISNSHSSGIINVGEVGSGGLVGLSQTYSDVTDSYSNSVVSSGWKAGGLVGVAEGNVSDCYATGTVNSYAYGAGGLVGYLKTGSIHRSYATGNVTAGSDSIGIDMNSSYAGGLVGLANNSLISKSYATGNVTGSSIRVGGLVGGTNSNVENSYATGDVEGADRVGGLVGGLTGDITNSYSIGKVTALGEWVINEDDQNFNDDGGGGGGGYFGGEGGQSDASPGAGGGGYLHSSLVTDGVLVVGNDGDGPGRALPPNVSDENYVVEVGLGGNKISSSGNGLIYIDYGSGNTTFSYTGDSQTFTVPSGVTSVDVKIWGAGGGGSDYSNEYQGGSGGYANGTIEVTPGQVLVVIVGGGGGQGFRNIFGGIGGFGGGGYGTRGDASGGGGGGLSGIFKNDNGVDFESLTQSDAIIIAGGGGGGTGYSGPGGAGGGENGNDGEGYSVSCGGTQIAGGACLENGDDGIALRGGNGDIGGIKGNSERVIDYIGGLVGYNSAGNIVSSFWDTETSEEDTSEAGGIGKTTAQMKNQNSYVNWDLENIWIFKEGNYPCLLWQDNCSFVEDEPEPESEPEPEIIIRKKSTGSTASSRYQNLLAMGKNLEAEKIAVQFLENNSNSIEINKFIFTKNLKKGIIDNEVKELQKFLNANGFQIALTGPGSKGFETNKFGLLTQKALIKFQLANKLKGDGIFGPITRGVMNGM